MRLKIFILLVLVSFKSTLPFYSQNTNVSAVELNAISFDNYTDKQVSEYWNKAKSQGYSLQQLEVILKSKGISDLQISKLKQRISSLKFSNNSITNVDQANESKNGISNIE
tara:strand:+ start:759 stop:1091 length:333 start_codon:yes stop_codon:yes gene_type:complete